MRKLVLLCSILNVYLLSAQNNSFTVSLYFDKAASDLSPANSMQLDDIKLMLRDSSFNAVFIKGYADNDGSDEYNLELSQKRVEAVQSYFNYTKYSVQSKCYGEKSAVNKNKTEDEKSLNRRVDVIFWQAYQLGSEKKKAQVYTFSPNKQIVFTAAEGTKIKIPANALVYENGTVPMGEVNIEITEFYSMSDIINNKLTTTFNGKLIESDGMININATRNNNPLRLKGGEKMEVGFAEREENDGFGLYYGKEDPRSNTVNWVPAANPWALDRSWSMSGARYYIGDTIEKWRSKFDFNKLGQRIKVTERWEVDKGTHYDTLIMDKTINTNKIILKATQLGWINCDQIVNSTAPLVDISVKTTGDIAANVVMIFNKRKAMINGVSDGNGHLVFYGVPAGESVTITGVGTGEGKLYFAKLPFTISGTPVDLVFAEASVAEIREQLKGFD